MPKLTMELANELLDKAIADRGADYVYEPDENAAKLGQCNYVHGDQPGCIVGHVLHQFGVSLETLKQSEGASARSVLSRVAPFTNKYVRDLLADVQDYQDNGYSWGESVRRARSVNRVKVLV